MKAVIFDMDGTVIDSMGVYEAFRLQVLYKCQNTLNSSQFGEIEKQLHLTSEEFIDYVNDNFNTNIDKIVFRDKVREKVKKKYEEGFPLKKGVLDFMDYLDDHDIPYCIATASSNENTDAVLKATGLNDRIEFSVTTSDVHASKLKPDIYEESLKRLGTNREDTYVFEDAPHAVMTAKEAGFPVVVIEDDYFLDHQAKLKKYGDHYFTDYQELLDSLD